MNRIKYNHIAKHISPEYLSGGYNYVADDWEGTACNYKFYKIYYFVEGECEIQMFNNTFRPKPEAFYLFPADVDHDFRQIRGKRVKLYWCHFEMPEELAYFLSFTKETVLSRQSPEKVEQLFQQLLQHKEVHTIIDTLLVKTAIVELLCLHFEAVDFQAIMESDNGEFYAILSRYIENNLTSKINVADLAQLVHLQNNYFSTVFKERFGESPVKYINRQRIEKATMLLVQNSQLSVELVALNCGFTDYRYFTRMFKKRYGVPPSEYRQISRNI